MRRRSGIDFYDRVVVAERVFLIAAIVALAAACVFGALVALTNA